MKKTLISLVLVFALLSTCVFSAVFAAYSVTSGAQSITATVSAFGITAVTITEGATDLTPGATGVLATTTITGTPALDAQLKYTNVTLTKSGNWTQDGTAGGAEYFPIAFTVGATTYKVGDANIENFDDLAAAVKTAVEAISVDVLVAGYDAADFEDMEIVSWEWIDGAYDNAITDGLSFTLTLTATVIQKP